MEAQAPLDFGFTHSQALLSTSMACGLKLEMLNRDLQTGAWGRGGTALQEAV